MATAAAEVETKSLPANAYQPLKDGEAYVPLVPASTSVPEVTARAVLWGTLLCVVFSVASAYSALKVGQGMEAAIPISILAIGLARVYRRRSTVLENVIITGIGGASAAVVSGAVFTLPALYILHLDPHPVQSIFICLAGGCLGLLFLIPLRRYFVAEQHGKLPFPEATAITEVLVTGEKGGSQAKLLLQATCVAAVYDFFVTTFHVWKEYLNFQFVPDDEVAGRPQSHGVQLRRHRLHPRPGLRDGPAHRDDLLRRRRAGELRARAAGLVRRQPHGRRDGRPRNHPHLAHDGGGDLSLLRALHRRGRDRRGRAGRHHQVAARRRGLVRHRAARLPARRGAAHGAHRPGHSRSSRFCWA